MKQQKNLTSQSNRVTNRNPSLNRITLFHTFLLFLHGQLFFLFQSLHECATSSTPDFNNAIHKIETTILPILVITTLAVFSELFILVAHIVLLVLLMFDLGFSRFIVFVRVDFIILNLMEPFLLMRPLSCPPFLL